MFVTQLQKTHLDFQISGGIYWAGKEKKPNTYQKNMFDLEDQHGTLWLLFLFILFWEKNWTSGAKISQILIMLKVKQSHSLSSRIIC